MIIELNGKRCHLADATTLADLIGAARGRAAVVDGEVVPRSQWATYQVKDGQVVELVTATQGG